MSNRRRQDNNPLNRPTGGGDIFEMDEAIYGKIRAADAGMLTAQPVSIFEIMPDVQQPRRLLPGALRYEGNLHDVLAAWWNMANEEAGLELPLTDFLLGEKTDRGDLDGDRRQGPVETSFMKLVNLAATIRRDGGLINPITIYGRETGYGIETGERRWLAHHLLAAALGEEQWHKISARQVAAPSIWRQAHENTARDDLNAISLARQLSLLVMDIYRDLGIEFEPYENFSFDRHYYAQVADGRQFPIPYGDGERLVAAMGVSNRTQVNRVRALLRLPDEFWKTGDDQSWPEGRLREVLIDLSRKPGNPIEQTDESMPIGIDHNANTQAAAVENPPIPDESTAYPESPFGEQPEPPAPSAGSWMDAGSGQPQPPADREAETPAAAEQPAELAGWFRRTLEWAHKRAETGPQAWFSAYNVGTSPETLNKFVERGWLESRSRNTNLNFQAAVYQIAAAGCEVIGRTMPEMSSAAATPPRPPKKLFDTPSRGILAAVMDMMDSGLDEADVLEGKINAIDAAIGVLHQKKSELQMRQ